jgi:hypothetical protein
MEVIVSREVALLLLQKDKAIVPLMNNIGYDIMLPGQLGSGIWKRNDDERYVCI